MSHTLSGGSARFRSYDGFSQKQGSLQNELQLLSLCWTGLFEESAKPLEGSQRKRHGMAKAV